MLEVSNLSYWYDNADQPLFSDLNLTFENGRSYAIVGQSGSGKTTFLSLIAGLDIPKKGVVKLDGHDVQRIGLTNYRKRDVSIVFQAYNLVTYMSALENVLTAMAITDSTHKGDKQYAGELLQKLGLTQQQMTQKVNRLSGGQQQRVAIARAMAVDANLVVADEPTGNLDEANTKEVVALFQQLAHEQNKCVIIVTHEMDVADECDEKMSVNQSV